MLYITQFCLKNFSITAVYFQANLISLFRNTLNEVIKLHDQHYVYENNSALYHLQKPITGQDIRLREKSFRQTEQNKATERIVRKTIKYYNKNYENILQQLNTTWENSGRYHIIS